MQRTHHLSEHRRSFLRWYRPSPSSELWPSANGRLKKARISYCRQVFHRQSAGTGHLSSADTLCDSPLTSVPLRVRLRVTKTRPLAMRKTTKLYLHFSCVTPRSPSIATIDVWRQCRQVVLLPGARLHSIEVCLDRYYEECGWTFSVVSH